MRRPSRLQTWIIRILGSSILIGGLFLLTGLIGFMLPGPYRVTSLMRLDQPPAEVFARVADFSKRPNWLDDITRVEGAAPVEGRPLWIEYGDGAAVPLEVLANEPPVRLVTRADDEALGFSRTRTWRIEAAGNGTTIRIEDEGELRNAFLRFRVRVLSGVHADQERVLTALARHYVESPRIERVELGD